MEFSRPDENPSAFVSGDVADPPPQAPSPPDPTECCGGGCSPCIYDLYDEAMDAYRQACRAWRARHPEASGVAPGG